MKYLVAVMLVLGLSGCTVKTVEFMESMQVEGQHEKAMKFLGQPEGTLVYKDTQWAKECKRSKLKERGYWMLQDDIDCWDNTVK